MIEWRTGKKNYFDHKPSCLYSGTLPRYYPSGFLFPNCRFYCELTDQRSTIEDKLLQKKCQEAGWPTDPAEPATRWSSVSSAYHEVHGGLNSLALAANSVNNEEFTFFNQSWHLYNGTCISLYRPNSNELSLSLHSFLSSNFNYSRWWTLPQLEPTLLLYNMCNFYPA